MMPIRGQVLASSIHVSFHNGQCADDNRRMSIKDPDDREPYANDDITSYHGQCRSPRRARCRPQHSRDTIIIIVMIISIILRMSAYDQTVVLDMTRTLVPSILSLVVASPSRAGVDILQSPRHVVVRDHVARNHTTHACLRGFRAW
jgi:hypothetical protein